jgi:predicted nuclease with TOPRIM domain
MLVDREAEIVSLRGEISRLTMELDHDDKENAKLENELRRVNDRFSRLQTRAEQLERLLAARTSALCALIELPDPKWVPKKEDMEP